MKPFLVHTIETVTNTYRVYGDDDDTIESMQKKFWDHEIMGAAVLKYDPVLIDTDVVNLELDDVEEAKEKENV